MSRGSGANRRVLEDIPYYPSPKELYHKIIEGLGWKYKVKMDYYKTRDRALLCLLYLAGLRVSEALRIHKDQVEETKEYVEVRGIFLSKSHKHGRERRSKYRDARLPLHGERKDLTMLFIEYYRICETEKLWGFGTARAWQIVKAYLPESTCHWLRAYCEDYLYDQWDRDLLAVADYIKVDARTLQLYIRKRHEKYKVV